MRAPMVKVALVAAFGLLLGVGCNVTRTAFDVPGALVPEFDTASNYKAKKGAQATGYRFKSVAVLPFGRPRSIDLDETVRLRINRLHELFDKRLRQYGHYRVSSPNAVQRAMIKHAMPYVRRGELEVATLIGKDLGVDTVLVGDVNRWLEREGSALGAKKPASVAFQIYLFRVEDGALLWKASFSKTQRPLSDNVLELENFLKGGATWQSSETLARLGVEEVMRTFPGHGYLHPRNLKF